MDIIVTPSERSDEWSLTDLFGRSMGCIREESPGKLKVHPQGGAIETMSGISHSTFDSLDGALADIETRTRGVCRWAKGAGQEQDKD